MQQLTFLIISVLVGRCAFSVNGLQDYKEQQAKFLDQVDKLIRHGTLEDYKEAEESLLGWCNKFVENSALLWRLAQCLHGIHELNNSADTAEKMALVNKGLEYAAKALTYDVKDADAHKWFAVLSGEMGELNGFGAKINGGLAFKKHLKTAIQLRPDDPTLHHLVGRFQYEVGKMSSFEKMFAWAVMGEISDATVENAMKSFSLANQLTKQSWKMNCVFLAKCYLHKKKYSEAKKWLDVAEQITIKNREDEKAAEEITEMRKKNCAIND